MQKIKKEIEKYSKFHAIPFKKGIGNLQKLQNTMAKCFANRYFNLVNIDVNIYLHKVEFTMFVNAKVNPDGINFKPDDSPVWQELREHLNKMKRCKDVGIEIKNNTYMVVKFYYFKN